MSIEILNELVDAVIVKDTKLLCMNSNSPEDFADIVRRLRGELSLKDVEKNSGGEISSGYVSQIENRHVLVGSITLRKLLALAKGLRVSEDLIFAAAQGKLPSTEISKADNVDELRKLLVYYFDHVHRECQLDMVASAQGVYQRRNRDAKVHERATARATTRELLKTDLDEHISPDVKEPRKEVAPPTPQQPSSITQTVEISDDESNGKKAA